ncbi:MAG: right-handed parallel beta-helix repeat-containing protein [Planctomycetota bacterium]|jgi:hypothetical protein
MYRYLIILGMITSVAITGCGWPAGETAVGVGVAAGAAAAGGGGGGGGGGGIPPATNTAPAQAGNPTPNDSADSIPANQQLSWDPATGATGYGVYFGTSSPGTFQGNQTATTFNPGALAAGQLYYWRVDAYNDYGSTTGVVWSFTAGDAPPAADVPIFPADDATGITLTPTLTWSCGGAVTDSFDVYFGNDSAAVASADSAAPEFKGNQTGTNYSPLPALAVNTSYYWRIDAGNTLGYGTTAGIVWSFRTGAPPAQAGNPIPAHTSVGALLGQQLSWSSVPDATTYTVYFGISASPPLIGDQTDNSYNPGALAANTTYYWGVDTVNDFGPTSGAVWWFRTGNLPGQAGNPAPTHTAVNVPYAQVLRWDTVPGATTYQVYFGTMSPGAYQGDQTDNSFDAGGLSAGQVYFWHVDSYNDYGCTAGVVWSFTAGNAPPAADVPIFPADEATGIILTPTLTWSCGGAVTDSFDIYFGNDSAAVAAANTGSPEFKGNDTASSYGPLSTLSENTSYYWRIDARNSLGYGTTTGSVWSFSTGNLPPQATLISPADGATVSIPIPTLQWDCGAAPPPTDIFYVYFDDNKSLVDSEDATVLLYTGVSFNWITYVLSEATSYYWRIIAGNSFGNTSSPTRWFETISLPPQATSPSPGDGVTGISLTPTLSWTCGTITDSFDVYFGEIPPGAIQGNQTPASFDPGTLDPYKDYYWRIDTVNSFGTTTGNTWTFRTGGVPAQVGTPVPGHTTVNRPITQQLSWNPTADTTGYFVHFGTTSSPPYDGCASLTTYNPGSLSYDTTYYWKVIAYNSFGNATSAEWYFRTVAELSIDVTTSVGAGTDVIVDSITYSAPYNVVIVNGSTISIGVPVFEDISPGWRYYYSSWSDAGARVHDVTPTTDTVYTATLVNRCEFTVTSDHGTPTGAGWYDNGSATANSTVNSPADEAAGTRYACTGWTGTGSAPASGLGNDTGAFTITEPSGITWNWKTQYQLTTAIDPVGGGTVTPADGTWYDNDSSVAVQATADPGFEFDHWTGGPSPSDNASSSVTMDSPKTITSYFNALMPVIISIDPDCGSMGTAVTIYGDNFSNIQGTVTFYDGVPAGNITLWNNTQIDCTVPAGAATGDVTVTTGGGTSLGYYFEVLVSPGPVTGTVPGNTSTGVPLDTDISVSFSEDMDDATINSLTFYADGGVTGTYFYNGITDTATLFPQGYLAPLTTYTVVLTTDIMNATGTPLPELYVFTFTTVGPNESSCVFVDQAYPLGDSDGTMAKPYQTINDGITAASGKMVITADGGYTENIVLVTDILIFGGYDGISGGWTSRSPRTSLLNASATTAIYCFSTITNATIIDGLSIYGGSAGETYGIKCDSSSPNIRNNEVASPNGNPGYSVWSANASPIIAGNTILTGFSDAVNIDCASNLVFVRNIVDGYRGMVINEVAGVIENSTIWPQVAIGLRSYYSNPTINKCIICSGKATDEGSHGMRADGAPVPVIINSEVKAIGGRGYGLWTNNAPVTLIDSTFTVEYHWAGSWAGAYVQASPNSVITNCIFAGWNTCSSGLEVYDSDGAVVNGCLIRGAMKGLQVSSNADAITVKNCIIEACWDRPQTYGVHVLGWDDRTKIVNNTINGGKGVSAYAIYISDDARPSVVNNIIMTTVTAGNSGYGIYEETNGVGGEAATSVDNNCFYNCSTALYFDEGSVACTTIAVMQTIIITTGTGSATGNIIGNPLFVGGAPFDYHIQSGSPCENKGKDTSGAGYGSVTKDYDGESRPNGSAYDIGADEIYP